MIIKCPQCGFSGRIPSHALGGPQVARCPKCRYRFDLLSSVSRLSHAAGLDLGSVRDGELDPGSSSYELKAITDDTREAEDPEFVLTGAHGTNGTSSNGTVTNGHSHQAEEEMTLDMSSQGQLSKFRDAAGEPWYARVLQVWGIVFMAWAALLMLRSLYLFLVSPGGAAHEHDLIPTIISVVCLVPGAAGLFLLSDLGRYVHGLRPATVPRSRVEDRPSADDAVVPNSRRWRLPLRFLSF